MGWGWWWVLPTPTAGSKFVLLRVWGYFFIGLERTKHLKRKSGTTKVYGGGDWVEARVKKSFAAGCREE